MRYITLVLLGFLFMSPLVAQDKLAIIDKARILNPVIEELISDKLAREGLEYTATLDLRKRCEYFFGTISSFDDDILVEIVDCNDALYGKKPLGRSFLMGNDQERAILLAFTILDIIKQTPVTLPQDETRGIAVTPTESPEEESLSSENEHTSRYFFAPSGYNLKEGELYYNTLYFFLHDIQYGLSDYFSIGMGTTLIGMPFYITPKISIPLSEKSTLAIGDMMIVGTWGIDFFGNLVYGMFTQGSIENNISLGTGLLTTSDSETTAGHNSMVFNISAMARTSNYVYFVTENYGLRVNTKQIAWYDDYNEVTQVYRYFEEAYGQKQTILYGISGLRFVNKNNDVVSWQFGLSYIVSFFENIPERYKAEPWYSGATDGGSRFIALPTISYTRKFGKKF